MSNVIDFLEKVGRDASLCQALGAELELALTGAGLAPDVESALRTKNMEKLGALMGQGPLCAAFFPGKEDEEQDDEKEETPSREPDESTERSFLHTWAIAG